MSNSYSPLLNNLKKVGLRHLLFTNEEKRDALTFSAKLSSHASSAPKKAEQSSFAKKSPQNSTQEKNFAQNSIQNTNNVPKNKTQKNKTLSLSAWPQDWLVLHERFSLPAESTGQIPVSQIRVAWTYEGLEEDALGVADPKRQALIKQIASTLNHKKGTHVFIPYDLPKSLKNEHSPNKLAMHEDTTFFWSAMRLVRPRVLLVFGSAARDALNLPKIKPLQKIDMGALQVLQMHKPETLAENQASLASTMAFLQTYLHFCPKK